MTHLSDAYLRRVFGIHLLPGGRRVVDLEAPGAPWSCLPHPDDDKPSPVGPNAHRPEHGGVGDPAYLRRLAARGERDES